VVSYSIAINLSDFVTLIYIPGYYWVPIVMFLQVLPFSYFCYLFYMFLVIFIPVLGRNGYSTNPDLIVGLLCGVCVFFALGFAVSFGLDI